MISLLIAAPILIILILLIVVKVRNHNLSQPITTTEWVRRMRKLGLGTK